MAKLPLSSFCILFLVFAGLSCHASSSPKYFSFSNKGERVMGVELPGGARLNETDSETDAPIMPKALRSLGDFNGISYYLADNLRLNWTDAAHHCDSLNMSMATVETQEIKDFIEDAFVRLDYNRSSIAVLTYWMGACDTFRAWESTWNGEYGIDIAMAINLEWNWPAEYVEPGDYCGGYRIYLDAEGKGSSFYVVGQRSELIHNGAICSEYSDKNK